MKKRKSRLWKDYALYRGDDLLMVGTIEELAKYMEVTVKSARFITYPSYHKRCEGSDQRIYAVAIEED